MSDWLMLVHLETNGFVHFKQCSTKVLILLVLHFKSIDQMNTVAARGLECPIHNEIGLRDI